MNDEITKAVLLELKDINEKKDRITRLLIYAIVIIAFLFCLTVCYITYCQYDYTNYPPIENTNTNTNTNK